MNRGTIKDRFVENAMHLIIIPMSIITFTLFGYDKIQAQKGGQRISEKALLIISILGGAIGGLLGMQIFRHKTRHLHFWLILSLSAIIHILLFLWQSKLIFL